MDIEILGSMTGRLSERQPNMQGPSGLEHLVRGDVQSVGPASLKHLAVDFDFAQVEQALSRRKDNSVNPKQLQDALLAAKEALEEALGHADGLGDRGLYNEVDNALHCTEDALTDLRDLGIV